MTTTLLETIPSALDIGRALEKFGYHVCTDLDLHTTGERPAPGHVGEILVVGFVRRHRAEGWHGVALVRWPLERGASWDYRTVADSPHPLATATDLEAWLATVAA